MAADARTAPEEADVVVIGMGPGGEDVAGSLAERGLSVVGVEAELVGGECPYWGCVPSKMFIRAANLLAETRRVPGMAGSSTATPDFSVVAKRIRDEATDDWDDTVAADRFTGKGGHLVRGRGRLIAPGEVEIAGNDGTTTRVRATRAVVLSAGTRPSIPPIPGLAEVPFWTNREALEATEVPSSLLVLGGGAIGVELAQAYARFGAQVTIVDRDARLIPQEEPESSALLAKVLADEGLTIRTGANTTRVAHDGSTFTVTVDGTDLRAERLLVATGRHVDLASLGVDTIGLDPAAPALEVDDHLRAAPGVWGVGDVTGKGAFTHVAMYQSAIAQASILGEQHVPANYDSLPRVTFTDPEIGSVGLTEAAAREKGLSVRTGSAEVPSTARGWIHKAGNAGVIKVVADTERGILVGATSAGPLGGEVLGALALAVHAKVQVAELRSMIYAYPTFHRGIEDAVRDLGFTSR